MARDLRDLSYRQTPGEVDDARLGGPVNGNDEHRVQAHHRAHVDYYAALATIGLVHIRQGTQSGVDDATKIHQERPLHILVIEDPSDVHHNVDVAEGLGYLLVGGLDSLLIRHIHLDDHHALRGMSSA